jgi:hypothetical protein
MGRIASLMRLVFLVVPCRMWARGLSRGGGIPLSWLAWMVGVVGLAGAASAGLALIFGIVFSTPLFQDASVLDHFFVGALGGLAAYLAWWLYSSALLAVLWVRGIAPDTIVAAHSVAVADSLTDTAATGRHCAHVAPMKWRRRGEDPLVPGALPAMFAFMAAGMALTLIVGPASKYDMALDGLKVVVPLLAASGLGCLVGRHRHGLDLLSGRVSP